MGDGAANRAGGALFGPKIPSLFEAPDARTLTPRCARLSCSVSSSADGSREVPAAWRRLSEFPLRLGQAETAAALATGNDVLTRQPIGSGKTLVPMLKAAAECVGYRIGCLGLLPPW